MSRATAIALRAASETEFSAGANLGFVSAAMFSAIGLFASALLIAQGKFDPSIWFSLIG